MIGRIATGALALAFVAGCGGSSSSSGHKLPDWDGWARYTAATPGMKSEAELLKMSKDSVLDDCEGGTGAALAVAMGLDNGRDMTPTQFFLCGGDYARDAVEDLSPGPKAQQLALIAKLEKGWGKH